MADSTYDWSEEAREILRDAAKAYGTQKKLSEDSGIPVPTLQKILAPNGGDPGISKVARLASTLGLSLDTVLGGGSAATVAVPDHEVIQIPVLDVSLSAGHGTMAEEGTFQMWVPFSSKLIQVWGRGDRVRAHRVAGDSMRPTLANGDWVLVDLSRNELRDGLHAVRLDDTLMVKRVQVEGQYVRLISDNHDYEPIRIDLQAEAERFAILGKVIWVGKDYVTY